MTLKYFNLIAITLMIASCTTKQTTSKTLSIDEHLAIATQSITNDILTPETMWNMGRIGTPKLSPDGKTLVFTITHTNITEDKNGQGQNEGPEGQYIAFPSQSNSFSRINVTMDSTWLQRGNRSAAMAFLRV